MELLRAQPLMTMRGASSPTRPGRFHLPATANIATSFAAGTPAALHTIHDSWDYHACRYIQLCWERSCEGGRGYLPVRQKQTAGHVSPALGTRRAAHERPP